MQTSNHEWFSAEMLVGVRVEDYTLESVLGFGGFGAVYLTTHRGASRALKVLYPPSSRDRADMRTWNRNAGLFLNEIKSIAGFNHPNIIRIHGVGFLQWRYDDPQRWMQGHVDHSGDYSLPYYVSEFLPEGIDRAVRERHVFAPAEVLKIGNQVCQGLAQLHGASPPVFHLDLNPGNIRLSADGRTVITDFGIARTTETLPEYTRFLHPGVAAPEQYAGEPPDARTDIFQVGALLFAMLTGEFPRRTDMAERLRDWNVPRDLAKLILRCLAYERKDRYQDVGRLQAALERVVLPGVEPSWVTPLRIVLRRMCIQVGMWLPPGRRKAALGMLSLAGGIVIFIWLIWPPTPPPTPIAISVANSSAKKEWHERAAAAFNDASSKDKGLQVDGEPITVSVVKEEIEPGVWDDYRSGTMVTDILSGKIKPTVASPAEESWIAKLKSGWKGAKPVISEESPRVAQTPFVIAMWSSRARALGCWNEAGEAGPTCTWEHILSVAASSEGWGAAGHPEWGKLKFGYGEPGKSNSGTFTLDFICMTGLHEMARLTQEEMQADNGCGKALAAFEKTQPRIYDKSENALAAMRDNGPELLDAVSTNEQEVVKVNRVYGARLREPIVAVYPRDGTIMNTHPFAILDGAPWVTPETARAAKVYRQYLLGKEQQTLVLENGLRPVDVSIPLGTPIDPTYGANAQALLNLVDLPDNPDQIVEVWKQIRASISVP